MYNIIILGPQGSGKGTQAKLIAKKFNLEYFEAGRVLREVAQTNTVLGKRIAKLINRGFLAKTADLMKILSQKIKTIPKNKKIIFDGIPRNLAQAKLFETIINRQGRQVDKVFSLWISRKETIIRLSKRRICRRCGRIFILGKNINTKTKKCPFCGGKIYQRQDDQPEFINRRLRIYYQETLPVIRYYYLKNKCIEINGQQSIKKVFQDILEYLADRIDKAKKKVKIYK